MDSITLNCPACKESLKFPTNQAGSTGTCPSCGTDVPIPKPPAADGDDDADGGSYGLVEVVEVKKSLPTEKKKEKVVLDPSLKKKKKLQDADKWNVVRGGLTVMSTAAAAGGIILGLQMLVVLLGCTVDSEVNPARLKVLLGVKDAADLDAEPKRLNRTLFAIALIYGTDNLPTFRTMQILLSLVSVFPVVLFLMGYMACVKAPMRFGMRGQVKAMMILAFVNVGILVVFRILPYAGIIPYAPLPYMVPELPLLNANAERNLPLHVTWMFVPYLDMFLTIVFTCSLFAEFALGGLFLHTVGFTVKDEPLRDAGSNQVQLALGTAFAFIVFHLFSLCGCSEVLISTLRLIYIFAVGGQLYMYLCYMQVINQARALLDKRMEGMTEEELEYKEDDESRVYDDEDDEEEDDDEEDDDRKKKKKRRKRDDDDEDDDDDKDSARVPKPKPPKGGTAGERRSKRDEDGITNKPKRQAVVEDDDEDEDEDDQPRKRKKNR